MRASNHITLDVLPRAHAEAYAICFCFRRQDQRTAGHRLNRACALVSDYIHCEICDVAQQKTLYITSHTGVNVFERRDYEGVNWRFVWFILAPAKYAVFRRVCEQILADATPFSALNAYCFPFFASPCYYQCSEAASTNCAITAMQVIRALWGGWGVSQPAYAVTPGGIHDLLFQLSHMDSELALQQAYTHANRNPTPTVQPTIAVVHPAPHPKKDWSVLNNLV